MLAYWTKCIDALVRTYGKRTVRSSSYVDDHIIPRGDGITAFSIFDCPLCFGPIK